MTGFLIGWLTGASTVAVAALYVVRERRAQ